ncbi:MAG: hypothetical protein K8F91_09070 [Candidatus Obscuribacterales bacterium]|nr:hypothetical protein [Candidatus Obscuribacterales bacterium]
MKLSILHKGLIIVSIPLLFEIFFVVVLMGLLDESTKHIRRQIRSQDKIVCVETILKELADSTITSIIYNVTRRQDLVERRDQSVRRLLASAEKLTRLTSGDEQEKEATGRIRNSAMLWLQYQEQVVNSPPRQRLSSFLQIRSMGQAQQLMVMRSDGSTKAIIDKEKDLQTVEPALRRQAIMRIHLFLLFGVVTNLTITGFLATYMARYFSARLDNVLANTFKLGARLPLNPPLRGDDEMAELDEALHASATELLEFEAFKEQLIGVVSHELRTPLTSISGTLTLLEAGAMGEFPEHALIEVEKTQESLNKLISLVNNLLLLERLEAGSQIIKQEQIALHEVIDSLIADNAVRTKEKDLTINVTTADITVTGDQTLLPQALRFLFDATISRAPRSSTIIVSVLQNVDNLEIHLNDEGEPLEHWEQVQFFSRSENEEYEPRSRTAGEILSLSLSKAILTGHKGSASIISYQSSTTIIARLPYRRASDD